MYIHIKLYPHTNNRFRRPLERLGYMCVYTHVSYVYIYIYVCIYIYTYMYVCIYIYIYVSMYVVYTCVCIYIYIYVYMYMYIHIRVHRAAGRVPGRALCEDAFGDSAILSPSVYIYMYMYMCVCVYIYIYISSHIYIYIYIYIYVLNIKHNVFQTNLEFHPSGNLLVFKHSSCL